MHFYWYSFFGTAKRYLLWFFPSIHPSIHDLDGTVRIACQLFAFGSEQDDDPGRNSPVRRRLVAGNFRKFPGPGGLFNGGFCVCVLLLENQKRCVFFQGIHWKCWCFILLFQKDYKDKRHVSLETMDNKTNKIELYPSHQPSFLEVANVESIALNLWEIRLGKNVLSL